MEVLNYWPVGYVVTIMQLIWLHEHSQEVRKAPSFVLKTVIEVGLGRN